VTFAGGISLAARPANSGGRETTRARRRITSNTDTHGVRLTTAAGSAAATTATWRCRRARRPHRGTTYHYRVVATTRRDHAGSDRTLRTEANPARPAVAHRRGGRSRRQRGAALDDRPQPRRDALLLRIRVERRLRQPDGDPGRRGGRRRDSGHRGIGGLRPYRRYHFRLVATNEAGTTRSNRRTFVTQRLPTAITLDGRRLARAVGRGRRGVRTRLRHGRRGTARGLERQDFPFAGPFSSIGTPLPVRTSPSGASGCSSRRSSPRRASERSRGPRSR
jgi:hypothetical protein